MKNMILLLLNLFSFTLLSFSQGDTLFNQVDGRGFKQGLWKRNMTESNKTYLYAIENYKDGTRDGLCIYFYPNGKKQSESYYQNNVLNGMTKVYRSYGVLQYEENFKNGRSDGIKRYYNSNGELLEDQEYIEGNQTGVYHLYSKNKQIIIESFYIDGIENGTRKVYSDNEKHEIIREFDFKNDIKIAARYYKGGRIIKEEKYDYEKNLKKSEDLKRSHPTIDS